MYYYRKFILIILLLASVSIIGGSVIVGASYGNHSTTVQLTANKATSLDQLQDHNSILVLSNSELQSQAVTNGWDAGGLRDGSAASPYLISGLNIANATHHPLRIWNTNLHIVIDGNSFDAMDSNIRALSFDNVTNIIVENNMVTGGDNFGITASYSTAIEVKNNTVTNNGDIGIWLSSCNDTIVKDNKVSGHASPGIQVNEGQNVTINQNEVFNNLHGIQVDGNNTLVSFNNIHDQSQGGIIVLNNANNNSIIDNTIINGQSGIIVQGNTGVTEITQNNNFQRNTITNILGLAISSYYASNNSFSDNTLTEVGNPFYFTSTNSSMVMNNIIKEINSGTGFGMTASVNNTVRSNLFQNGVGYAMQLFSTSMNNLVTLNNFTNNLINSAGTSQVRDDGVDNQFIGNYYSDWTGPDNDEDDIVDTPYDIEGTAGNQDLTPVATDGPEVETTTTSDTSSTDETSSDPTSTSDTFDSNAPSDDAGTIDAPVSLIIFGFAMTISIRKYKSRKSHV